MCPRFLRNFFTADDCLTEQTWAAVNFAHTVNPAALLEAWWNNGSLQNKTYQEGVNINSVWYATQQDAVKSPASWNSRQIYNSFQLHQNFTFGFIFICLRVDIDVQMYIHNKAVKV